MKKLFILGKSGHAKVILDIAQAMNAYSKIFFLDPSKEQGEVINGISVAGSEENLDSIANGDYSNIEIAIGIGDNSIRSKVYEKLNKIHSNLKYAELFLGNSKNGIEDNYLSRISATCKVIMNLSFEDLFLSKQPIL